MEIQKSYEIISHQYQYRGVS